MPNLSSDAIHQFWHEYKDPMIYRVVSFMEGVEHWTQDGDPELEVSLQKLGDALDDIGNIDLQQEDQFIKLCTYIKCGRALKLLQAMDSAHPGAASKLLMHAEEVSTGDDVHSVFLRRNIVFERLRLLARVFSPERVKVILKSMEDDDV